MQTLEANVRTDLLAGADNDNTFGFFKRPTKATFINRVQKVEVAA